LAGTIVIKLGGSTLGSHDTTLADLVALQKKGVPIVVVHGGANTVTDWLRRMNISSKFVKGLRVTDAETLKVVVAILAGLVNKELVADINTHGRLAVGIAVSHAVIFWHSQVSLMTLLAKIAVAVVAIALTAVVLGVPLRPREWRRVAGL